MPHLLNVCVAHVLDADNEYMLVVGDDLANVLKQLVLVLARLLGHLGHVDHSVALRLGHLDGICVVCVVICCICRSEIIRR